MSNNHLRNKEMSLKSKGLLSVMLSLPDDWDYSINGLVAICKESSTSVRSALAELEQLGYLKRTRINGEAGKFDYQYDVFENPCTENPCTENPYTDNQHTENPCTENPPQLNTNKLNTKELNTKELNTNKYKQKHRYGSYNNVLLSDEEMDKLKSEFTDWEERIERVSEYCASTGRSYKNYLATIRSWARKEKKNDNKGKDTGMGTEKGRTVEPTIADYNEW